VAPWGIYARQEGVVVVAAGKEAFPTGVCESSECCSHQYISCFCFDLFCFAEVGVAAVAEDAAAVVAVVAVADDDSRSKSREDVSDYCWHTVLEAKHPSPRCDVGT
jgi:hypothetical protein